jgi:uncharacterized repeat protein (TIGR02059 family)
MISSSEFLDIMRSSETPNNLYFGTINKDLKVIFDGETDPSKKDIARINYTPMEGDRVVIYKQGQIAIIIGRIGDERSTETGPKFVSATTNIGGTSVIVTFNEGMAEPINHENEFVVKLDGAASIISSTAQGVTNKDLVLYLTGHINRANVVTLDYNKGTFKSLKDVSLESFKNKPVTNIVSANPPVLISAATNTTGNIITLTFDKNMADPSGKQAEFAIKIDGNNTPISSVSLNTSNPTLDLAISVNIASTSVIKVSYTKGTAMSSDGGTLESFSNVSVTNNVPAPSNADIYHILRIPARTGIGDPTAMRTVVYPIADPYGTYRYTVSQLSSTGEGFAYLYFDGHISNDDGSIDDVEIEHNYMSRYDATMGCDPFQFDFDWAEPGNMYVDMVIKNPTNYDFEGDIMIKKERIY